MTNGSSSLVKLMVMHFLLLVSLRNLLVVQLCKSMHLNKNVLLFEEKEKVCGKILINAFCTRCPHSIQGVRKLCAYIILSVLGLKINNPFL